MALLFLTRRCETGFRLKFTALNVFAIDIYVLYILIHNNVIENDKRIVISGSQNILNEGLKHHIVIMKDCI